MFDYINMYYLLGIWIAAGTFALMPMFLKSYWAKIVVVPVVFAAIAISFLVTEQYLGAPLRGYPANEFQYIHHEIAIKDSEKYIFLWTRDSGDDRLHRFVWDQETQDKLEQAKQKRQQGIQSYGRIEFGPNHERTSPDVKMEIFNAPSEDQFTKEY